jgi:epsilon-lactone hydrolase
VLASQATDEAASSKAVLVGVAALSPVTDLTLSGDSYATRADADPFFTREQVAELVRSYLGGVGPMHPLASPLYGPLFGLPPVRIHVGDDEVLLDDSRRYVERAIGAGVDARLDVWMGMPHGLPATTNTARKRDSPSGRLARTRGGRRTIFAIRADRDAGCFEVAFNRWADEIARKFGLVQ